MLIRTARSRRRSSSLRGALGRRARSESLTARLARAVPGRLSSRREQSFPTRARMPHFIYASTPTKAGILLLRRDDCAGRNRLSLSFELLTPRRGEDAGRGFPCAGVVLVCWRTSLCRRSPTRDWAPYERAAGGPKTATTWSGSSPRPPLKPVRLQEFANLLMCDWSIPIIEKA